MRQIPVLPIETGTFLREKGLERKVDFEMVLNIYNDEPNKLSFDDAGCTIYFRYRIPNNALVVTDYSVSISRDNYGRLAFCEMGTALVPIDENLKNMLGDDK